MEVGVLPLLYFREKEKEKPERHIEKICNENKIVEGMFIYSYLPILVCVISIWLYVFYTKKHNSSLKPLDIFPGWSRQLGNCSTDFFSVVLCNSGMFGGHCCILICWRRI